MRVEIARTNSFLRLFQTRTQNVEAREIDQKAVLEQRILSDLSKARKAFGTVTQDRDIGCQFVAGAAEKLERLKSLDSRRAEEVIFKWQKIKSSLEH